MTYELIRSARKTVALQINSQERVIVRAPLRMPVREIDAFVQNHREWIEKHLTQMRARNQRKQSTALSAEQVHQLRTAAREALPERVARYAQIMGLRPASVRITSAKARWGSCSGKNGLCFSWRVMLLPEAVRDYIVVHELAHIRQKNHSAAFYAEVARWMPDYRARVAQLREYERALPV